MIQLRCLSFTCGTCLWQPQQVFTNTDKLDTARLLTHGTLLATTVPYRIMASAAFFHNLQLRLQATIGPFQQHQNIVHADNIPPSRE
jgi:hypothetical protein